MSTPEDASDFVHNWLTDQLADASFDVIAVDGRSGGADVTAYRTHEGVRERWEFTIEIKEEVNHG